MAERAVLVPLDIDPALPGPGSRACALAGTAMGTAWSARFLVPPHAPAGLEGGLRALLQAELDLVVAQMSHWKPDSLLARFNAAPAGSWHDLPPEFFAVIDYALQVRDASGGAYDPAAGALVNLWGFGPVRRYDAAGFYAPAADAVAAIVARRGAASVELDRAGRRLFQPGGALLDLSSVAKGFAVDRLALCLERHGLRHYLVEAGGELRGAGARNDGQPWWVEVEGVPDADGSTVAQAVVALHGLAIATSGDYRQYFHQPQGRRVAHTLDPRSGWPVDNGVASVTVLAPTCMAADALSTTLAVLGPQAGIAFADARGLAARYLVREAGGLRETVSGAWTALLE
ncbi:FAD:protein FMN transferase [uncultured Massilia sp.]|uniref:FAD:protein FMN transferase n=1 Tax=uncultured Massilia sp. TaxID=169973 RepID=UPI0025D9A7F1|nr:FAD:protein FMN transferase [uncultured Massilia sp.]